MAESLPVPNIGDISVPGSLKLTGGAGGAATNNSSNQQSINFGSTTVNGKDKSTMIILAAVTVAFLWISHK